MQELESYDYALLRVMPSIERGECINCGVILFCRRMKFLEALISLVPSRLHAIDPRADIEEIRKHLDLIPRITNGDTTAGPIARLSQSERFHWLVAPRSAIIQTSPVHSGVCADPRETLQRLMKCMVALPELAQSDSG